VVQVSAGRRELLSLLKRQRYKEILEAELVGKKSLRSR
jgi:hypothetical protein